MELVFCGVVCGNVNEFGDDGGGFGKSFFFFCKGKDFLELVCLEIGR